MEERQTPGQEGQQDAGQGERHGTGEAGNGQARSGRTTGSGLEPKVAGALCYVLGWVSGLVFLLLEKENQYVRFHAMQAIYFGVTLTVAWIAISILAMIPFLGVVIWWLGMIVFGLGALAVWIVLMVRAYQGEKWRLPYLGDYAARAAGQ